MLFPIILTLSFICGFVLPWWFAAVIALVAGFYVRTNSNVFWQGFAAVGLTWLALSLLKTLPNNNILATRMATLFHLPGWVYVLAITVFIGGLVGGFSALSGKLLHKALEKPKTTNA